MKERPPAFQFYPRDFLSSEGVRVMTATGRGAYITLLCVCWLEGSLPTDDEQLRRLSDVSESEWKDCRETVIARFVVRDGRLHNYRLDKERAKQRTFSKIQSDKGQKSAESRRNRGATPVQPNGNPGSTAVQPEGNSSVCILHSASSSASSTSVERSRDVRTAPAIGEGAAGNLWELFRTKAATLRGATLPLNCRNVEFSSLLDFLSRYPDPAKQDWLIDQFLTTSHRPIVQAPVSIGQLCKWAPWLEAQTTATVAEPPRTAGNRAAADEAIRIVRAGGIP